jgi:hypothetical protein
MGFRSKRTFRLLRAAGETETTQENIQDWLELAEEDSGFQFLTKEGIAAVIFLYFFIFISTICTIKFSISLFYKFFVFKIHSVG